MRSFSLLSSDGIVPSELGALRDLPEGSSPTSTDPTCLQNGALRTSQASPSNTVEVWSGVHKSTTGKLISLSVLPRFSAVECYHSALKGLSNGRFSQRMAIVALPTTTPEQAHGQRWKAPKACTNLT